jgi:hypothetical protein
MVSVTKRKDSDGTKSQGGRAQRSNMAASAVFQRFQECDGHAVSP